MFEADPLQKKRHSDIEVALRSLAELQKPMLEKLEFDNTSTETLSRYGLALIIEVAEFLNETPWKMWKKGGGKAYDTDRMKEEFADLLSYLGSWINFLVMLGISIEDMAEAYQHKRVETYVRFGAVDKEGEQ